MASKTLHTNQITFMDLTDDRKLDVYITSNLPTTQIKDANNNTYTPDWGSTNLVLSADIYLDSVDVTDNTNTNIIWYEQIGTGTRAQMGTGASVTINTNKMTNSAMVTYSCEATYQNIPAYSQLTFTRVDTGKNGADGTSVNIKGTATSVKEVSGTDYYTIVYSDSSITLAEEGDAYVYNGDLYVCVGAQASDGTDYFINVGRIQGPAGKDAKSIVLSGDSQVFKVSNNEVYVPDTIKVTATAFNTSITTWSYSPNGGQNWFNTLDGIERKDNVVTITGSTLTTDSVVIKASDGSVEDVFTVYKAANGENGTDGRDGQSASMAFLTNENVTFAADSSGKVRAIAIPTNIVAYNGTQKTLATVRTKADGTIDIQGLPVGMSATSEVVGAQVDDIDNRELSITLNVSEGATFGSALSNNGLITIPVTSPVNTDLVLTWSKVNSGAQGSVGPKGADAYTVLLTNESHVFAGDVSNAMAGQATTQVLAYNGASPQTVTISSVDGKAASTIDTDTNIAGLKFKCSSLSGTSPTITFTCTTAFKSANGTIPIVLSVGGVQITKMFTYSIAFKGNPGGIGGTGPKGDSATAYWLVSGASTIHKTSTGTIAVTPSTITFTGKSQTGTNAPIDYACRWIIDYSTDGTTYNNLATSTTNEASKTITVSTTYKTIRARMYMADGTSALLDEQIIPVVSDGATGPKGVSVKSTTVTYGVSDSASTIPADNTWQSTIPVVAEGKYLWTRTIIDYTDDTIADTVTYTYAKQGSTGATGQTGSPGTSVTVKSIKYQSGTSATIAPTGTWSDSVVAVAEGSYLWTQTTFSDNKVAYGVAKQGQKGDQGVQGPKGNDAYTVILTNESHIFAGDISNAIAGTAETQILAYNGSTTQSVTIASVNGKTAATADTDTGIAGLKFKCSALSGTNIKITFTCTTSFVSKSGAIPIVLSVGGVSFTKMFTYSISFKGATGAQGGAGTPASLVNITPSAHYFKSTTGKDGAFTPDYIYLYPRFQTVTYSKWEYSINGGISWTTVTSGSNGLTIGTYNSVANSLQISKSSALYTDTVTSISFRCVSSNSAVYDTVSIAKIYDVVDLQIGGRNLILSSNVSYINSEYRVASYNMSEDWEFNSTYTLTLKGTIEDGKIFGAWANGSGTRVATLTYDAVKGVYTSTFVTPATIASQTPKVINIYNTPSTTPGSASIEWIKLEKGNKATDWSPAPEDLKSTTFQLYAPKGYLITNDVPTITLETFAYDGSQAITNATFAWYSWNGESWVVISGATGTSLTINRSNVFKSNVYKCDMTYGGKVYTATVTVEDKTDIYDSLIHVTSKYSPSNRLYWVLYSTVYSEEGEKDELLGPVSVTAPTSPVTGAYWYKIDETNYTVTLMKYSGTAWVATTDQQEFVYDWFMLNDTNSIVTLGERSKVKIVTSDNFSRTCSVQCNVLDQELAALTHCNQVLNDPSDPIVSETEPSNPINGQLWIKTGANGSYVLLVWDASNSKWVVSEADTQKKVYVSKPTTYNDGDIWIVAAEYEPDSYIDGVLQTEVVDGVTKVIKHLAGTMLRAQYGSDTYKDSDWVDALIYKKELDKLKENLNVYNQFFTFDNTGMTMKAKSLNGQISEFSTKLTNNELGFYQGENKVAYINNNQLNISKAEITNGMTIGGDAPMFQIGNFVIMQESNGSLSIGLKS